MKSSNLGVWKILATTAMTTLIACGSSSDTSGDEGGTGVGPGTGGAAGSGTAAGGKGGKGGAAGSAAGGKGGTTAAGGTNAAGGTTAAGGHAGTTAAGGHAGTAPQGQGGTTPQGQGGTTPQGQGGTTPQGQGGTTPQGQGGTTPQGQGGTTPQGQGGTTSQGQGGTTSQGQGGTTSQGQGGTTSQGQGGSAGNGQGQGGTTSQGQGGTTSQGQGGTTSQGQGGTTSQGQGGTTSQGQGGTTSQGQGGTTSQGQGGTTSQGQGGTTSQGQGGTTSVGQGGTTSVGQGGSTSTGGSNSTGAGGCTFIGGGPGCGTGGSNSTGAGGSLQGCGNGDLPDVDDDKDGWTENQGDCNDCDPNVNPGALDIINVDANGNVLSDGDQVDEDCDKHAVLPSEAKTCDGDASLTLAATDPFAGTAAIDLCRPGYALPTDVKTPGGALDKWGVVSATYVQLDGKALPKAGDIGHGIQTAYGTNVKTQLGKNMLQLSSGTARLPGQIGFDELEGGGDKGYTTGNPPGFPIESASCPGIETGTLHDSVALKVVLKVPTNANSLSFKFKFYTFEFPNFTCSTFNDVYVTVMNPVPVGGDVKTGNISFDPMMDPLSVNAAFLDVCDAQTAGGKAFTCAAGNKELAGTGFDAANAVDQEDHGGTTWLQTTAPVTPGSTITLMFGISDAGDGIYASSVLIDDFQWSAQAGTVATESCRTGGTAGDCTPCIQKAASSCCSSQYQACKFDQASDGCDQLLSCLSICGGIQACTDQCHATHATGEPEYTALEQCLYGVSGDKTNRGACGVACNTP